MHRLQYLQSLFQHLDQMIAAVVGDIRTLVVAVRNRILVVVAVRILVVAAVRSLVVVADRSLVVVAVRILVVVTVRNLVVDKQHQTYIPEVDMAGSLALDLFSKAQNN